MKIISWVISTAAEQFISIYLRLRNRAHRSEGRRFYLGEKKVVISGFQTQHNTRIDDVRSVGSQKSSFAVPQ